MTTSSADLPKKNSTMKTLTFLQVLVILMNSNLIVISENISEEDVVIDESLIFDYESEFGSYQPSFNQEEILRMQVLPKTSQDVDVDICKASKSILQYYLKTNYKCFCLQMLAILSMARLERAHISSNSSFMDLENFEFENIMSEKKINFSNLSLSLTTSLPSFGSNILGISSFIEFGFLNNTNHQSQPSSSNKTRQIFEFGVARSSTMYYLESLWRKLRQNVFTENKKK